jgi:hypothetical protein
MLWHVLHKAVLRHVVGSPAIMRAQLNKLAELEHEPDILKERSQAPIRRPTQLEKKPRSGASKVPITNPRSKKRLNSSQLVSGSRAQP